MEASGNFPEVSGKFPEPTRKFPEVVVVVVKGPGIHLVDPPPLFIPVPISGSLGSPKILPQLAQSVGQEDPGGRDYRLH